MIAETEILRSLHSDSAKLLAGVEIGVPKWGRRERIRVSILTLGIKPLVWDLIAKLIDENHLSLWERTQARSKELKDVFVVAIGRRPLSESRMLIFIGEQSSRYLRLDPGKDGIVANIYSLRGGRGISWENNGPPTPEQLSAYGTTMGAVMNPSNLPT